MELRWDPTSLRRTHEVVPMTGEPEVPTPEEKPDEGLEEQSDAAQAEVHSQDAESGRAESEASENEDAPKKIVVDESESMPGAYHVALPSFEGPLDLLLHLIQQHELDIKDIPISFISKKYVEYITLMQELNIDLASEYLVMAATLAHIKSKMLLPKPPSDQDDDAGEELDPRSELVRRLLEYQKYKNAAEQLGEADVLGRDVFLRGAPAPMVDGPAQLAQISVFKLFDAFQKLLSRAKENAEHLIDVDRISISERIIELTDLLRGKGRVPFVELFDETMTRSDLIVSFLAVLEMTRLRMMVVIQVGPLQPIEIELTLASEHDDILKRGSDTSDPLLDLSRADLGAAPLPQDSQDGSSATESNEVEQPVDPEPAEQGSD